jgi:hypothetical protein
MRPALAKTNPSEAQLGNAQDKVLEGYKTRFGLGRLATQNLHMFFSPTRVPMGLTEKEVRIVLLLYPLRDANRRQTMASLQAIQGRVLPKFSSVVEETALPAELRPKDRMTRESFQKGVMKFLERLAAE